MFPLEILIRPKKIPVSSSYKISRRFVATQTKKVRATKIPQRHNTNSQQKNSTSSSVEYRDSFTSVVLFSRRFFRELNGEFSRLKHVIYLIVCVKLTTRMNNKKKHIITTERGSQCSSITQIIRERNGAKRFSKVQKKVTSMCPANSLECPSIKRRGMFEMFDVRHRVVHLNLFSLREQMDKLDGAEKCLVGQSSMKLFVFVFRFRSVRI